MTGLAIRPAEECGYDLVALGEVMLRLDPGEGRIRTTREFRVWEGGGEYNVARGLRRCFGLRTAIVTALADNDIGRLIEDLVLQGGVDTSLLQWARCDGMGQSVRNGLNFVERGYGIRGARGVSDRGNTAASQLAPGKIDWGHLFGELGVRWFHTGGIFAALSETTPAVIEEAFTAAKAHGTVISYDLNYRPSLWKARGGIERARELNRRLAPQVDVMIGVGEDLVAALEPNVEHAKAETRHPDAIEFQATIDRAATEFPNLKAAASTLRTVKSVTINDWSAIAWTRQQGFTRATPRLNLEVLDRIGGGDSFASGFIYGLMQTHDPQQAVEYGAAHGALAMTTPGDTSTATLEEVEALIKGDEARVQR